jgi:hypothetical protein
MDRPVVANLAKLAIKARIGFYVPLFFMGPLEAFSIDFGERYRLKPSGAKKNIN